MSKVLCPMLGTDQKNLITKSNLDSLTLSSYDRLPGTVVKVSCYVPSLYRLDGPNKVECNSKGAWIPSVPKCVKKDESSGGDTSTEVRPTDLTSGDRTVVSTSTILLIVTSIVAFILLALVILLAYKLSCRRNKKWETLRDSTKEESCHQKPVVSTVTPGTYTQLHTWQSQREPDSSAPSWHSHPIITSGQPFESSSWREFTADKYLYDLERSRRDNPNHSWRDFTTISTRFSSSTTI